MTRRERRPRVLLFSKGFPPTAGGLERYGFEVARAYRQTGTRPIVITQFEGRKGLRLHCNVPVVNVGTGPQVLVFIRMLLAARAILRRRSFSFAHATTWRVALPAIILGTPGPVCVTIHGREILTPGPLMSILMRRVFRRTAFVSAISEFTLDAAAKSGLLGRSHAFLNWNGVGQIAAEAGEPKGPGEKSGPRVFFTICRLVERKNIQGCIRALAELKSRGLQEFVYYVAGDGAFAAELESIARQAGVADEVRFLGRVSDARKTALYRQADVFLHPQIALQAGKDVEGFGLVIAEAMAHGLPVVAGQAGGAADFVTDRVTGRLVDGESLDQIVEAIDDLISDGEQAKRLAAAGREWVGQHLSWENHVRTILRQVNS